MARIVDLGGHTLPAGCFSNKLMAEDALESHVALSKLQVGIANSDRSNFQDDLAGKWNRARQVATESDGTAITVNGSHDDE